MYVFTDKFLQKLDKRYGNLLPSQQPPVYRVATLPYWKHLRKALETWVGLISNSVKRNDVIRRLQTSNQFEQTYHELVMGDYLRLLGYSPIYEKEFIIGNKIFTPDWYIDSPKMVIEVFSSMPSNSLDQRMNKLAELANRLELIQLNIRIEFLVLNDDLFQILTSKQLKTIVRKVEQWLIQQPVSGEELLVSGIRFRINSTETDCNHVTPLYLDTFWGAGQESVEENIRRKVKKYLPLSMEGIAITVAIFPSFIPGFSNLNLNNILYGQEAWQIIINNRTDEIVGDEWTRQSNGLFSRDMYSKHLSAVLLMSDTKGKHDETSAIVHLNPEAQYLLFIELFDKGTNQGCISRVVQNLGEFMKFLIVK